MASQYLTTIKVNGKDCKLSAYGNTIYGETVYYDLGYGTTTLSGVYYRNGALVDSDGRQLSDFEVVRKISS
ncbi:hypothetical protein [Conchiformibius steedae]|uniref:Uncharacterized protein n=1 Tax=Conchiformibius steedae TaxID=153493 RepID=A0A3P2A764_9NEIS|nr:hypothetical protein [Conchiformibius steedae]RRD91214.1 hypothetical protein EII21_02145 [Conchiformibius steedae]